MPDQHSESVRNGTIKFWRPLLSAMVLIVIALAIIPFREKVVGAIVRGAAYIVWVLNLYGRVIPQQILWFLLLILILYIAVGSFYGKKSKEEPADRNPSPVVGPVKALTRWIEEGHRGIYFKWQIANLLGKIQQSIQQTASRGTSSEVPAPPAEVQVYLDAGVNTSYADYPVKLFQGKKTTPFDIDLKQVVDYLEQQMEINNERQN